MKRFQCSPEYRQLFDKQQFGIMETIGGIASGVADNFRQNRETAKSIVALLGAASDLASAKTALDRLGGATIAGEDMLLNQDELRMLQSAVAGMLDRLASRDIDISGLNIPIRLRKGLV